MVARRSVVVTGLGLVTCLGTGVTNVWKRILQAHCGLSSLDGADYEKIPCKVAGLVPRGSEFGQLDLDSHLSPTEQRRMSMAACYALAAAEEAITDAGWHPKTDEEQQQTGVAVGVGVIPLAEVVKAGKALAEKGYNRVSPYFVPSILNNMAAGHISIKYGLKGVNHSVSTACATGAHSIGDAFRFIQHGSADVMICGGTEACVEPLSVAAFARMRALSTGFNSQPQLASRPFDSLREGFVMSEGAGILVLEEREHAERRGANIHAEILGYGLSGDANHITAPSESGDGAYRCMLNALKDAQVQKEDIGYINAHATSTPLGDRAECKAITRLLGNHSQDVAVSSTKGAIGHLLGAAGAVEAILTILACKTGHLPPTLNCTAPDPDFDLNFVPLHSQVWPSDPSTSRLALTNSFGFGGTNTSLCFKS